MPSGVAMIISEILNGVRLHVKNDHRLIAVANDMPLITGRGRVQAQDLVIGDHIAGWGEIVWIEHFRDFPIQLFQLKPL